MSEADKMFEELGYKKIYNSFWKETKYKRITEDFIDIITFNNIYKKVLLECFVIEGNEKEIFEATIEELKAINKKVSELGWL